jgi:hypothetical protein
MEATPVTKTGVYTRLIQDLHNVMQAQYRNYQVPALQNGTQRQTLAKKVINLGLKKRESS